MANIFKFLRNNTFLVLSFTNSQYKEINSLFDKYTFKIITILDISSRMRIFNSRFVNKIKNKKIATAFEKSIVVVQVYNNHSKKEILTQLPTI